ncbi:hypothetical protein L2E82_10811 [Cichorium intybus]|uniref:Uncharacterized protein n=1 Tax=Cichorium intybus TaxID=13427 RepID=A0ACB9GCJ9_CICIN|nr:hypothetical protein L2E82_10811 [Cichorium intybus]
MVVDTRNSVFFTVFFSVVYYLITRWREKVRNSTPVQVVTVSELAAVITFVGSCIYLILYFGTTLVLHTHFPDDEEVEETLNRDANGSKFDVLLPHVEKKDVVTLPTEKTVITDDDEVVIQEVVSGKTPSYLLESKLGDCKRAVFIRRVALERITGKLLDGLPVEGFDYGSILGQCCEMPVGYVQIPVGIAGPMLLDGKEVFVPMATTEGCLVASTNRGCKAIYVSGGVASVLLKDGMTRAPVVRFGTAKRAAELKFFLEEPLNFQNLSSVFNR